MLGTHDRRAVRVLYRATTPVTRGIRLKWPSPRSRDTPKYCRAFSGGAVTTCFYDLGLSRLGFELPTWANAPAYALIQAHIPTYTTQRLRFGRGFPHTSTSSASSGVSLFRFSDNFDRISFY